MSAEMYSWYIPTPQRYEVTADQQDTLEVSAAMDRIMGRHFPQNLRQAIESVASDNNISRWDIVRILRECENPDSVAEVRRKYQVKILDVGCLHGASPEFVEKLNSLAEAPEEDLPDMIIFGGDLAGAIKQRTIRQKQYFYDYLMNRAGPLLSANPEISREDLLNATGDRPPVDSPNVRAGALKLLQFTLEEMAEFDLSNLNKELEIKRLLQQQMKPDELIESDEGQLSSDMDEMLYQYIRWIRANNLNSGTWVGTLPDNIRQRYMNQYQQAAEDLVQPLLKLKGRGVDIVWVEGNEDNRLSLEAIAHGLERVFDIQQYFGELGIKCERQITGKDGKATYHILMPFYPLRDYDFETDPDQVVSRIKTEVETARVEGKTIIIVAHAQLNWSKHYPGQKASGYNAKVAENLKIALEIIKPDELVYPHQHAEMPGIPDTNAKYIDGRTVVSYLPLLAMGELAIPVHDRKGRENVIFGGIRQPVRRIT